MGTRSERALARELDTEGILHGRVGAARHRGLGPDRHMQTGSGSAWHMCGRRVPWSERTHASHLGAHGAERTRVLIGAWLMGLAGWARPLHAGPALFI
jgi:hypothetical protein